MKKRLRKIAAFALAVLTVLGLMSGPSGAHADGYSVRVSVKNQVKDTTTGKSKKEPVAGVKVEVFDETGALVGEGVTDDKGVVLVEVPAPATYTVKLDVSTLPEGFELTDGTNDRTVDGDSFVTSTISVNYFTGKTTRTSVSWWSQLSQRLVDGARFGLLLAMCSVGLSLIFGTTGLTNFAHGELVTFGAMIAYILNTDNDMVFWIAAPIAVICGGLFGLAMNEGVYSPLRKRKIGLVSQMVVSVGLAIVLKNLFLRVLGGRTKAMAAFNNQQCNKIGPVCITSRDATTALVSLVLLVLVAVALQKTRLGKATRAVSDNPDLASSTGIDSQRIIRIVWILGGMLAATGGIFRGLDEGVGPFMGADLLFLMFSGITLGGLGSAYGALVGSFVIGMFVEVSTLGMPIMPGGDWPAPLDWLHDGVPSELKNVPAYVAMILVLLLRPQGILGRRERVG